MNRRDALKSLAAVAGAAMAMKTASFAHAEDAPKTPKLDDLAAGFIKAQVGILNLAPGLDLLMGPGGNITVLGGEDGVVVVDSGVPQRGKDVLAAVNKLHDTGAKTLINTHWHFDHAGGNEAFAKGGYHIIAHDNTRTRLSAPQTIDFMNITLDASPAVAWPTQTLTQGLKLFTAAEELEITSVPPAHTDTDLIIHFKKANVLQTGDVFFHGFFPFIDYSSGGNIDGMIVAADKILAIVDDQTKVVPGHGPMAMKKDLQASREMLITVRDRMKVLVGAGKSLEEVSAAKPLADLDEKWGQGPFKTEAFTILLYKSLTYKKA